MAFPNLLAPHVLIHALPEPQNMLGMTLHGTISLSDRPCRAVISTGAPRTLIRADYARGVGFLSVPRQGRYVQRADGSWHRTIEYYHPTPRLCVEGYQWRVRPVEGDTGAFDLILGADWLYDHQVVVDVYDRSFTIARSFGRLELQFAGDPAVLELVPSPPAAPHAPAPAPEPEPEEEPEEEEDEPMGNGFIEVASDGEVAD